MAVIERLKNTTVRAVPGRTLTPLPEVHVLDLAKEGLVASTDLASFPGLPQLSVFAYCKARE